MSKNKLEDLLSGILYVMFILVNSTSLFNPYIGSIALGFEDKGGA